MSPIVNLNKINRGKRVGGLSGDPGFIHTLNKISVPPPTIWSPLENKLYTLSWIQSSNTQTNGTIFQLSNPLLFRSFTFRMHFNKIKERTHGTFAQNNKLTNLIPSNKCNLYPSLISPRTQLLFIHISYPIFLYKPEAPPPNSFETTLPTYLTQCRI